jgi:hypothetical protein
MTTETTTIREERPRTHIIRQRGASEAVYGLGMIGAWIYYVSTATTFWMGALGILKGIFWPAFLVFEWMKFLGM